MKAAVVKGKQKLEIEEKEAPKPGPGEVVLEVRYCGICGSDIGMLAHGILPVGMTPGHEFSGVVAELGGGVSDWKVGDRATVNPFVSCGDCVYCRNDAAQHCANLQIVGVSPGFPGAFAEYVKLEARCLHRVSKEVSDPDAATVEPCAVALRAVRRSGLRVGDSAVVLGTGPIGLFVIQCARLAGAGPIWAVEPSRTRAEIASTLGAERVFDPQHEDVGSALGPLIPQGPDVIYVCSDAPSLLQQAVSLVKKQGKIVLVAGGYSAKIVPELLMWKEAEIIGSFAYPSEFRPALDLYEQGRVTTRGIISGVVSLEQLPEALGRLTQPSSDIKILVQPSQAD